MTFKMDISEEIRDALASGAPVVALETTIVTHGMPAPINVETALAVEGDIRELGAIPAAIAVMGGVLKVGLSQGELDLLAQANDVAKLSRADIAYCIANGGTGSTTVAATMIGARLAGIDVFATGGIGGVHRGADRDFDISADLQELAQSPVTVVCAGPKAILDVPGTLEVLESLGVPVMAYGQDDVPAFWSRSSGLKSPLRVDDTDIIANSAKTRREMGIQGGQLIVNPIPVDDEIPAAELAPLIDAAIKQSRYEGIAGKGITPFLLGAILDATEGRSLNANIALMRNNARLAAGIAKSFSRLR